MAGFCYSCSITCHTDHDVYELWTKRHFRCDCGNSKFGCNGFFQTLITFTSPVTFTFTFTFTFQLTSASWCRIRSL